MPATAQLPRYAVILAGGSGVRLWPMSRRAQPKQLIPLSNGRSLLQLALARLKGLVPERGLYICSSREHRQQILDALDGFPEGQYIGEPAGRDTLAAIGVSAAVISRKHPDAVMGVFTADHLIEPVDAFQKTVASGYEPVERHPEALVTFGIEPDSASTGFGYLELEQSWEEDAYSLMRFEEKPGRETAQRFFDAGPTQFLWNSGMFVWRVSTILECIRRYAPDTFARITAIAAAWDTAKREAIFDRMYAELRKISIDYAVMEPASHDPLVRLAALSMRLRWLDVGSWPAYFRTLNADQRGNAVSAASAVLHETNRTLIASSDPRHLIATVGCEDLIIVHTDTATLVCRSDQAEIVKQLYASIREKFGEEYV